MTKKIFLSTIILVLLFFGVNVSAEEVSNENEMLLIEPSLEIKNEFDAKFLFCEDSKCSVEKKDFFVNETVFINYKAKEKLPLMAVVKFISDGSLDRFKLPGFYEFKKEGKYEFSFEVLIDSFKDIEYKKNIIVKERTDKEVCKVDNQCTELETPQNCPQDCMQSESLGQQNTSSLAKNKIVFFLIVIMFITIIIMALVYFFLVRKSNKR